MSIDYKHILEELDQLIARVDSLKARQAREIETMLAAESEMDTLFWRAIHRHAGRGSLADAKREFFLSMPPASGDLRILQQALTILLVELDRICRLNGITYFLSEGTLLGANRHKGFIPWDDDVDVFMLRDEVGKLIRAMKGNTKFSLRIFLANVPQYIRIVRFAYNDERLHDRQCFVDIFLLDWVRDTSDDTWKKYLNLRNRLSGEFVEMRDRGEPPADILALLTEKYAEIFKAELNPRQSGNALCWGWDNFTFGFKRINEYDFVFPLAEVEFEGHRFPAPKNPERYSLWRYGDWLSMPRSMMRRHAKLTKGLVDILKEKIDRYGDAGRG